MSINSDYARNVAQIRAQSAAAQADAQRQSGQIWGQTLANVGQTVATAVGQIPAAQKQAQLQAIFKKHGTDFESAIPELMKVDPTVGMDIQKRYHESKSAVLAYQEHQLTAKDRQLEFLAAQTGPVLDAKDPEAAQAAYTQALITAKWADLDVSGWDPDVTKALPKIQALRTGTEEGRKQVQQQMKAIEEERARLKAIADAANVKADNERADAQLEIARQTALSNRANADADNNRQDKALIETQRHNRATEAKAAAGGGRGVTSGDANRLAELNTSLNDLKTLRTTIEGVSGSTGTSARIGAALPNFVTEATGRGASAKAKQAMIDRVKQVIGKSLEGGVLRKEDEAKYTKILPTIGDVPSVVTAKLNGLDQAIQMKREELLSSLEDAGYNTERYRSREQAPPPPSSGGGGLPKVGDTFNGGRVLKVTPIP